MSLGPLLSVFALVSTHVAGGVLQPRQLQQVYGGVNISAQVLCISNYISHPVCNATAYCVQLVTEVVSGVRIEPLVERKTDLRDELRFDLYRRRSLTFLLLVERRSPNVRCSAMILDVGAVMKIQFM